MKKINFSSLRIKLFLSFGVIIILIALATIFTSTTLKSNKDKNELILKVLTPSSNLLNDYYDMVSKSNMLAKNWVFIDKKENTPDKIQFKKIHDSIYPFLKNNLGELKAYWNKEEIACFDTIISLTDSLFLMHQKNIIEKLSKFEDYEDALVLFEITPMVEVGGSISNLTEIICKKVEILKTIFNNKLLENSDLITNSLDSFFNIILIIGSSMTLIALIVAFMIVNLLVKPILTLKEFILILSKGQFPEIALSKRKDEIGDISKAIEILIEGLRKTAEFAKEIGEGNLKAHFKPLSEKDMLGNALIDMQHSLEVAHEEEIKRKKEDDDRNWATHGVAMFGDILRGNHENIKSLCFEIIKNLVKYTEMNQGGIFLYNDEDKNHPYLELTSCYAYNRQKFMEKKIEIGEGLVGTCFLEGLPIYMTDVPDSYVNITSGLGEATPRCILIVPLKLNEVIYGVIEVASFKTLDKYQIEFIEKVSESVASTISTVKINLRTAYLLEKSQQQAEEMRAQEEEMRQNMEELQATQEEMGRKNAEIASIMNGITTSMPYLETDLQERILKVNDLFSQMCNLQSHQIKGISLKNLFLSDFSNSTEYSEMWSNLNMGMSVSKDLSMYVSGKMIITHFTMIPIKTNDGFIEKIAMFVFETGS